jgi:predicted kinase
MLTVMVGPTGVGKTTWLRTEEASKLGIRPSQILNPDDIRADLGISGYKQEKSVFKALYALLEARVLLNLDTVIDGCNLSQSTRKGLVKKSLGWVRYIVIRRALSSILLTCGQRDPEFVALQYSNWLNASPEVLAGDSNPSIKVLVYDV